MSLWSFIFYKTVKNRMFIRINFFDFLKYLFVEICQPILIIIDN